MKRKYNEMAGPSKVVHVSGIPHDCTDQELLNFGSPFGTVTKHLNLAAKAQAFIEFDSIDSSSKLIAHYATGQAFIRSSPISMQFSKRPSITPNTRYPGGGQQASFGGYASPSGETPSSILLVTILNQRLPVTLDNLYQVFNGFGTVERIVTFEKKGFKAFIEYPNVGFAMSAKQNLNNKDLFQGCCTLLISFSNMTPPLKVVQNNERAQDYTQQMSAQSPFYAAQAQYGVAPAQYGAASAQYGAPQAAFAEPVNASVGGPGHVVLINGLNPDLVTCDKLMLLFGVYGDVQRVKILYNKKSTALVQYANREQSFRSKKFLDKITVFGSEISITKSKNPVIALPPKESKFEDSELTKDYSKSPLHRFKIAGSRNENHIAAPSNELFLSGLPQDMTDAELLALFQQEFKVVKLSVFGKDGKRKMAYVTMPEISDGIDALIRFHNEKIRSCYMRISFSHGAKQADPVGETMQV